MARPSKLPSGKVFVPLLTDDRVSGENLRDLKRSLEGGSVYFVNRQGRTAVGGRCKLQGDVSQEACEETFQELSDAIDGEMMAQMDPKVLRALTLRVASHISVGPGMQAVLAHALPPALWQPSFTVCVGYGQVRVLTLAYVGQPMAGDRPSEKQTGTVLRMLTSNLSMSAGASAASARYKVFPAAQGADSIEEHLEALEPLLSAACDSGDWSSLEKTNPPGRERSRSVSLQRAFQDAVQSISAPNGARRHAASVPRGNQPHSARLPPRASSVTRALQQVWERGGDREPLHQSLKEEVEGSPQRAVGLGAEKLKEQLNAWEGRLRGLFNDAKAQLPVTLPGAQPRGREGAPVSKRDPSAPPRKVMVDRKARMQAAMLAKAGQPAPASARAPAAAPAAAVSG